MEPPLLFASAILVEVLAVGFFDRGSGLKELDKVLHSSKETLEGAISMAVTTVCFQLQPEGASLMGVQIYAICLQHASGEFIRAKFEEKTLGTVARITIT